MNIALLSILSTFFAKKSTTMDKLLLLLSTLLFWTESSKMQQRTFNYSLKNIPIPSINNYKKHLIESVEDVIKRMLWKATFFNSNREEINNKNTFGLKSKKCPPPIKEMEHFESELLDMTQNVELRMVYNEFQKNL